MVLATVLLHRVSPDKAREFLAELETEPEIVEAVAELLAGQGAERDLNRQLFQDVLALLEEGRSRRPSLARPSAWPLPRAKPGPAQIIYSQLGCSSFSSHCAPWSRSLPSSSLDSAKGLLPFSRGTGRQFETVQSKHGFP